MKSWCKEWRQGVRHGSRLLTKSWTRDSTTARRKPQQPKVEIVRRAEKRPIVAEKLCYVIERGGNPSSPPSAPWRALREGELPLCSSDFKLEERCSSSRRAPLPRPRPAPRCLKFVYFSTGGETNREFWKRLNTLLGEGVSSDKIRNWTKFCSLLFLAATKQLSNSSLLLKGVRLECIVYDKDKM